MKIKIFFSLLAIAVTISQSIHAQTIITVAGNGTPGYSGDNGQATAAELNSPTGVAKDGSGNLYIAEHINNRIRVVTASGVITTIAGNGTSGYSGDNGPATDAELHGPYGVAIDGSGNIYIADALNQRIRKVNTSGIITTIAGTAVAGYSGDNGAATDAQLNSPYDIAVDGSGNIYIADLANNRIRKVNSSGVITTIAGNGTGGYSGDNGPATDAELAGLIGIAVDGTGNIYIADSYNNRIRKINASGIITTVAGNGTGGYSGDNGAATTAELNGPFGVTVDDSGNLYIIDLTNERIRKVNASGIITTIAGNGTSGYSGDNGPATAAELSTPSGITVDGSGKVYIADASNQRIRKVANGNAGVVTVNNNNFNVRISPNPATDKAEITYTGATENITVYMTDVTGRAIYTSTATANNGSIILPLQSLAPGYYMVVTQSGEQKVINKLIKQ